MIGFMYLLHWSKLWLFWEVIFINCMWMYIGVGLFWKEKNNLKVISVIYLLLLVWNVMDPIHSILSHIYVCALRFLQITRLIQVLLSIPKCPTWKWNLSFETMTCAHHNKRCEHGEHIDLCICCNKPLSTIDVHFGMWMNT
jgi:hypothetical protein